MSGIKHDWMVNRKISDGIVGLHTEHTGSFLLYPDQLQKCIRERHVVHFKSLELHLIVGCLSNSVVIGIIYSSFIQEFPYQPFFYSSLKMNKRKIRNHKQVMLFHEASMPSDIYIGLKFFQPKRFNGDL